MELNFDIPDLSQLPLHSTQFALRRIFNRSGPKATTPYALVMNYVRLVDLAVSEYEYGRLAILDYIDRNGGLKLGRAIRSSSHFEVCIDALKRAINHLKALRGNPNVPQHLKDLLPRGIRLLSGDVENKITQFRHAIQHLEERLQNEEIIEGQSLALQPTSDGLELGSLKVKYQELAEWIKDTHALCHTLIAYQEE